MNIQIGDIFIDRWDSRWFFKINRIITENYFEVEYCNGELNRMTESSINFSYLKEKAKPRKKHPLTKIFI